METWLEHKIMSNNVFCLFEADNQYQLRFSQEDSLKMWSLIVQ